MACTTAKVCEFPAGRGGISNPAAVANTSLPPAYSDSSFSATCIVRLEFVTERECVTKVIARRSVVIVHEYCT